MSKEPLYPHVPKIRNPQTISKECDIEVNPILEVLLSGNDVIVARTIETERDTMRNFQNDVSFAVGCGALSLEEATDIRKKLTEALETKHKPTQEWGSAPFAPYYKLVSGKLFNALVECECGRK